MARRRILVTIAAATAVLFGASVPAWAYFTASVSSSITAGAASLAAVTGVGATVTDANDVLVSWTAPSNPTGTTYTASTTAGTACTGATSCTVSGLAASTPYTFTVTPTLQGWTGPVVTKSATTTAAATLLTFTSTALSGAASNSASIGAITIEEQSAPGVAAPVGSAVTVNLSSNSPGTSIFATSPSGTSTTSVTIPAHSSSVSFYYGDTKAGSPMITAAASGLTSTTQTETITAATASTVVFTTQPSGAVTSTAFTGQPVAAIEDALGNVVTSSSAPITLAITSGTGATGATLSGCSATTTSGVASFSGCKIDKAGTGYTLTASSGMLSSATSSAFAVTSSVATGLSFTSVTTNGSTAAIVTCTGAVGSATFACTISPESAPGKGRSMTGSVTLIDANQNPIANSGTAITVTLSGTSLSTASVIIPTGSSASSTSFTLYLSNGNSQGTVTATATVSGNSLAAKITS